MGFPKEKGLYELKIDREFRDLIRPLFKNEYLQLEANLIADGCREPIAVWNGVIVDGHNRYSICRMHQIPFAVEEMYFSCREEVTSWICANQLGRRNLTEESRKFLIGKQYEAEKLLARRRIVYKASDEDPEDSDLPYETFDPNREKTPGETRRGTAERIAMENHISHGTVEKYSIYSRAIEDIGKKAPQMARKILSGRYKISHEGVVSLSKRSAEEIQSLNKRLDKTRAPFAKYQTTRQEIRKISDTAGASGETRPSVKDMPQFDPDAEVVGLTLTIPSWSSSIDRILRTDLEIVSDRARHGLYEALIGLQRSLSHMLEAIREDR